MALGTLFRPDAMAHAASDDAQGVDDARGWRGVVDPLHVAPRAKRIIHLYMAGGPSHLETFDDKPELAKRDGQPMPESFTKGQQIAQLQGQKLNCFAPQFPFMQYGRSGLSVCSQFPKIGSLADDLCIIRSMQTDQINHDRAHTLFNTGSSVPGRPSIGAWLTYGLGDSTRDLPSYVVLTSIGKGGQAQPIAARQWASGFLPSRFQGVEFRSKGDPVLYVFRTVRNPNAPGGAEFVPELIHNRSGVGSQLQTADLNGDGAVDVLAATDRGTFIFWGSRD